jgi:hypothetical protein
MTAAMAAMIMTAMLCTGMHQSTRYRATGSHMGAVLGPVNTCKIAALLPEIRPGKARGEKFGYSK